MYDNIFYFSRINKIGGVESFFYYLAKKYQDRDILIVYTTGNEDQLRRLRKYVRVHQHTAGDRYKCKKAFFNYNCEIIDCIEAEEYIQIIHADYKAQDIMPEYPNRINKFLGVSKHVCETFKEHTGYDCELCYLPLVLDKPKKVLNLISATRLTAEKGRDRMIKLANTLDQAGVPYLWHVFTNSEDPFKNPNIVLMKPRLDITRFIQTADYLVQLSSTEAYCYTVAEALSLGTPVIVTDLPVYKEIGLTKKNSIKLPLDMSEIPIDKMMQGFGEFEYRARKDKWDNILVKGKSKYLEDKKIIVEGKVIEDYYDLELNKLFRAGDMVKMNKPRAEYIQSNDKIKILEGEE